MTGEVGTSSAAYDIEGINDASSAVFNALESVEFTRHITPSNLQDARAQFVVAFRAGRRANPRFEYSEASPDVPSILREAERRLPRDEPWRTMLANELTYARQAYEIVRHHTAELLTEHSIRIFGPTQPEHAVRAVDHLKATSAHDAPQKSPWGAPQTAGVLATALAASGLETWTVELSTNMNARMAINSSRHLVRVRADAAFSFAEVRRLIVHEIGTHAFRTANAHSSTLGLLARRFAGCDATEEGLAVYHEQNAGLSTPDASRRYAIRYIACHAAITQDFCGVVDALLPHTSLDEAFEITARVKRGMTDASQPGGYLKDQVYFAGGATVRDHLATQPNDYDLLMASKWPIEHTPILRDLQTVGLVPTPRHNVRSAIDFAASITNSFE